MSNDDFNYWAEEHYESKEISGSEDFCMQTYADISLQYPNLIYGTRIHSKQVSGEVCHIVIRRFRTKELCRRHFEIPLTYVREGRVL